MGLIQERNPQMPSNSSTIKQEVKRVPGFADGDRNINREIKKEKDLKILNRKNDASGADLILLALALIGLGGAFVLFKRLSERSEARDSGGLATIEEAVEAYGSAYGRGGYMLGKYTVKEETQFQKFIDSITRKTTPPLWLKLEDRFRMTKIQASLGSGKTTQFIVPQLMEDAASGIFNIFVIDRKPPELDAMTSGVYENFGHKVIRFNPWIPETCWGFEPLFGANADELEAMVEVMIPISHVEDSTWLYRNMDRKVVRTLFRAAQIWGKKDRQLATLPAIAELLTKGYLPCREAVETTKDKRLIEAFSNLGALPSSDLGRMFEGLAGRFSFFIEDPEVAQAFSRSDFTMKDLVPPASANPENRTILYVGASQSKGDRSRKIASLLTRLITIEAFRRGDEMRKQGKSWKDIVPLWMCLDERGTYYIPEDDDAIATFRSLGVSVTIALQSDKQLNKWQGKDAAETMDTNFNFYVVLGGCDLEYAKKISEEIGTHWVWVRSETKSKMYESFEWGKKKSEGEGWRKVEEPVLKPNEIMQLPDDEAIIVGRKSVSTGRKCPPIRVKLYAFYKSEQMSAAVGESEQKYRNLCSLNAELDRQNRLREKGQPEKLPKSFFNWDAYLQKN